MPGGEGGGGAGATAGSPAPPGCEGPDDAGDDGTPATRLSFDVPLALTCRPERSRAEPSERSAPGRGRYAVSIAAAFSRPSSWID